MRRFNLILVFTVVFCLIAPEVRAFWWGPSDTSLWRDRKITVDGNDKDWLKQEQEDSDDSGGIQFAFANDAKNLYVLVVPHTRSTKAQMAGKYGQDFSIRMGGRRGGMGGRRSPSNESESFERINVWVKVKLASAPK